MRIDEKVIEKVKEIDTHTRSTWDTRAIGYVTGISHGSVAKILREYRGPRPGRAKPAHDGRTRFLFRDVMWSSDCTETDSGRVLLRTTDEKSDFTLGYNVVRSENAEEITEHAENIIARFGRAPLVWKYDNGSAFKSKMFENLLDRYGIIPYPIHRRSPWTNGRTECGHKDVHRWVALAEKAGLTEESFMKDLDEGMLMLNYEKPRAVLGYKTAARTYFEDRGVTEEDRVNLWKEVERIQVNFVEYNHRRVVRIAMQNLGLYEEWILGKKETESVNRSF